MSTSHPGGTGTLAGHIVARIGYGAMGLGHELPHDDATAVLRRAAELGVNHIDTAASYGHSELRLAPWLVEHRSEVFLATKTGDRTGDAARASLERSLERLGVDQVRGEREQLKAALRRVTDAVVRARSQSWGTGAGGGG